MSIINSDYQICLAYSGETYYDDCGGLLQETGEFLTRRKLILTDGQIDPFEADKALRDAAKGVPKIIYLEDCETTSISYPCNEPTSTVDDGKFVEIVNTCTEPITVTGLNNSDPSRFTVFGLKYRGIETYHSGICEELPFTVAPYTKKEIPSFFHPSRVEIEDGNAGSYENRTGDAWSAKISLYPGFPIMGCENMDPCDSFYTLSGELICNKLNREPLRNIGNFQGVYGCEKGPLDELEASDCLVTSGIYTETVGANSDNYIIMQNLSEAVQQEFYDERDPPDVSMFMASKTFKKAMFGSSDYPSMTSSNVVEYATTPRSADGGLVATLGERWDITGVYNGELVTVNYGDELYTGMRINVTCDENGPYVNDVGVFFNLNPDGVGLTQYGIFLSEWGDFGNTSFCYSRDNIELEVEPYSAPADILLWNERTPGVFNVGSEVTEVAEESIGRVGWLQTII